MMTGKSSKVFERSDDCDSSFIGVNCYRSSDFVSWERVGHVLSPQADTNISDTNIVERPKVIYNEKNEEYVMWFHGELPIQLTNRTIDQRINPFETERNETNLPANPPQATPPTTAPPKSASPPPPPSPAPTPGAATSSPSAMTAATRPSGKTPKPSPPTSSTPQTTTPTSPSPASTQTTAPPTKPCTPSRESTGKPRASSKSPASFTSSSPSKTAGPRPTTST